MCARSLAVWRPHSRARPPFLCLCLPWSENLEPSVPRAHHPPPRPPALSWPPSACVRSVAPACPHSLVMEGSWTHRADQAHGRGRGTFLVQGTVRYRVMGTCTLPSFQPRRAGETRPPLLALTLPISSTCSKTWPRPWQLVLAQLVRWVGGGMWATCLLHNPCTSAAAERPHPLTQVLGQGKRAEANTPRQEVVWQVQFVACSTALPRRAALATCGAGPCSGVAMAPSVKCPCRLWRQSRSVLPLLGPARLHLSCLLVGVCPRVRLYLRASGGSVRIEQPHHLSLARALSQTDM